MPITSPVPTLVVREGLAAWCCAQVGVAGEVAVRVQQLVASCTGAARRTDFVVRVVELLIQPAVVAPPRICAHHAIRRRRDLRVTGSRAGERARDFPFGVPRASGEERHDHRSNLLDPSAMDVGGEMPAWSGRPT
jgi:hypothetical protein